MTWAHGLTGFGVKLYELIKAKGWSIREFADRAGAHHSNLSEIKHRKRPPPMERVPEWLDLVGATGDLREFMLDLAALENTPARALAMFDPSHPGHHVICLAVETHALRQSRAAEEGDAYDARTKRPKRRVRP